MQIINTRNFLELFAICDGIGFSWPKFMEYGYLNLKINKIWFFTNIVLTLIIIMVLLQNTASGDYFNANINDKDPLIQKEFQKIHNVKYAYSNFHTKSPAEFWADGWGDCDDKSVAFVSYLKKRSISNVKYVRIYRYGIVSHVFVLWQKKAYDPAEGEYGINYVQYLNKIYKYNKFDKVDLIKA